MKRLLLTLALSAIGGCSQPSHSPSGTGATTNAPEEPASATRVIDDLTGKTAVDAGRRAAATIRKVNAQEQKDYKEIQGE
jgi:hypothetical protein